MKSIFLLENAVQEYSWGSIDGIASVTGMANPEGKPFAELWMGTHPSAPSKIVNPSPEGVVDLTSLADDDMQNVPGFSGGRNRGLPFLFKVLSAATPLSLQVHPDKIQAENGFRAENGQNIPIHAPDRNYRDDNHKPEIMAAVTPFKAMCGFREIGETLRLFDKLALPEIDAQKTLRRTGDYGPFITSLLTVGPAESAGLCERIILRLNELTEAAETARDPAFAKALETAMSLSAHYPGDLGILSPFYLNVIDLAPGEALYLPAGIMHAYIEGTGFELMANSDNVLRGGLTPKHIDVSELLSILNPRPFVPVKLRLLERAGIRYYPTPATEFLLGKISVEGSATDLPRSAPIIAICTQGTIRVEVPGDAEEISKGIVGYIRPGKGVAGFSGNGECWFATLPGDFFANEGIAR